MARTMLVILTIEVDDLSDEERRKIAREMEIPVLELEGLQHIRSDCIGERLVFSMDSEAMQELIFEGSDYFVKLIGADLIATKWIVKEN